MKEEISFIEKSIDNCKKKRQVEEKRLSSIQRDCPSSLLPPPTPQNFDLSELVIAIFEHHINNMGIKNKIKKLPLKKL